MSVLGKSTLVQGTAVIISTVSQKLGEVWRNSLTNMPPEFVACMRCQVDKYVLVKIVGAVVECVFSQATSVRGAPARIREVRPVSPRRSGHLYTMQKRSRESLHTTVGGMHKSLYAEVVVHLRNLAEYVDSSRPPVEWDQQTGIPSEVALHLQS